MEAIHYLTTIAVAYLLGSLPTGFLAGKCRGIDIRTVGSGNMGATNVFRTLGKGWGIGVLLLDMLKGIGACILAPIVANAIQAMDGFEPGESLHPLTILAGVCGILGHNYTCWLNFKGGKGIATTAGVLLILIPKALGVAFATWVLTFLISRYVSLASIAAAAVLPFAAFFFERSPTMAAITLGLSCMAIFKHRSNIARLRAGTEHRFGKTKKSEESNG